jgi:hypothetical protein
MDLHGTGPIGSTGGFSIPLGGTVTLGTTILVGNAQTSGTATSQVTGALDGAFFGPNAEQVGGVWAVGQIPGNAVLSDAFVGLKQ